MARKAFDPKAKERRQKIIAAVGAVILLAVLAYQMPTILSLFKSETPAASPAPAPAPAPAAGTPAAGTPAAAPAPSATLVDSDPAPEPAAGQLISFDRFSSKDPFVQQVTSAGSAAGSGGGSSTAADLRLPGDSPVLSQEPAPKNSSTLASARISVNGVAETVEAGQAFPTGDPIFRLVSVTKTSAKIGIVGGSFASGSDTVTLAKGKPLTLMNTAEGTRYELKLL